MARQSEDGMNDDDWWDPISPFPLDSILTGDVLFDDEAEVVAYKMMPLHPMTRKTKMTRMESQCDDDVLVPYCDDLEDSEHWMPKKPRHPVHWHYSYSCCCCCRSSSLVKLLVELELHLNDPYKLVMMTSWWM